MYSFHKSRSGKPQWNTAKNAYSFFHKRMFICRFSPDIGFLRQHRTIWQEVSDRIFAPIQSSENGGILYVFPIFGTAEVGQKDGWDSQAQLCGVALMSFATQVRPAGKMEVILSLKRAIMQLMQWGSKPEIKSCHWNLLLEYQSLTSKS